MRSDTSQIRSSRFVCRSITNGSVSSNSNLSGMIFCVLRIVLVIFPTLSARRSDSSRLIKASQTSTHSSAIFCEIRLTFHCKALAVEELMGSPFCLPIIICSSSRKTRDQFGRSEGFVFISPVIVSMRLRKHVRHPSM